MGDRDRERADCRRSTRPCKDPRGARPGGSIEALVELRPPTGHACDGIARSEGSRPAPDLEAAADHARCGDLIARNSSEPPPVALPRDDSDDASAGRIDLYAPSIGELDRLRLLRRLVGRPQDAMRLLRPTVEASDVSDDEAAFRLRKGHGVLRDGLSILIEGRLRSLLGELHTGSDDPI